MNIYCFALPEDPNSVLIINLIQFTTAFSSSYRALTPPIRCRHPVSYGPYAQTHLCAKQHTPIQKQTVLLPHFHQQT